MRMNSRQCAGRTGDRRGQDFPRDVVRVASPLQKLCGILSNQGSSLLIDIHETTRCIYSFMLAAFDDCRFNKFGGCDEARI